MKQASANLQTIFMKRKKIATFSILSEYSCLTHFLFNIIIDKGPRKTPEPLLRGKTKNQLTFKPSGDFVPVDDIPESIHIVRTSVLII